MNLEEKKNLVIQLHQEGKTQREIAKIAHMSVRDISKIIRKLEGISEEKSIETQALDSLLSRQKTNRSSCCTQSKCSKDI